METTSISLASLSILLVIFIYKRWKRMSIFKNLGIPGPKPNLFFGNLMDIKNMGISSAIAQWNKEYGKVFGYFLGGNPMLVILDTDLLKQIQIKDFHSFTNRPKIFNGGSISDNKYAKNVLQQDDDRWKDQRAILTPTFTSGKMKQMIPHLNLALDVFFSKVDAKSETGDEFDLYEMFKGLTLDVISRTAFGTETNVQLNPNDPFLEGVQDFLRENPHSGLLFLSSCFPEFSKLFVVLRTLWSRLENMLSQSKTYNAIYSCEEIVEARRSDPKNKRNDLLQLMLDAEISRSTIKNTSNEQLIAGDESEYTESIKSANVNRDENSSIKSKYYMSNREVISNTLIFVLAGYETTSTALGYMSHALICNPSIQEKIRKEIKEIEAEDGELRYSSISKMKYLDQVLSETLRFYSAVPVVGRAVSKEERYGSLLISKDVTVQVPITLLHADKDLWKNPEVFDPERFSLENKKNIVPMSYQPFGSGPRNCVGMRFAQMEAKLAMAKLLSKYRLVASDNSEIEKLSIVSKLSVVTPKKGVWLKVEKL